jgi:hypothetical protein
MNQKPNGLGSSLLTLLFAVALIGGIVQCSNAQAFEVTYYYLPG